MLATQDAHASIRDEDGRIEQRAYAMRQKVVVRQLAVRGSVTGSATATTRSSARAEKYRRYRRTSNSAPEECLSFPGSKRSMHVNVDRRSSYVQTPARAT